MAAGEVSFRSNVKRCIKLLENVAASNGAPSDTAEASEAEGHATFEVGDAQNMYALWKQTETGCFFMSEAPESSRLFIECAGSGVMTCTAVLWGYLAAAGKWFPLSVNGGAAIAETASDVIKYTQEYTNLGVFDRLYLQVTLAGTTNTCNAYLATCRKAGA